MKNNELESIFAIYRDGKFDLLQVQIGLFRMSLLRNLRPTMSTRMNYKTYIYSSEWRGKHKDFLKRSHYRCSMFPWIKCGKKHRYNCHHMNYRNKGSEQLWIDVIVLCPFVHSFIIHGILSGFRSTTQQKNYPNKPLFPDVTIAIIFDL